MRYAKGIMWLDDCRIPFVDEGDIKSATPGSLNATGEHSLFGFKSGNELDTKGRFTPNLLVCDDMLNDGSITQNNKHNKEWELQYDNNAIHDYIKKVGVSRFNDKGTNSRYYDLDLWFDKMIERL